MCSSNLISRIFFIPRISKQNILFTFFQVMTYHDALMQQLKTLLTQVEKIRSRLQQVDQVVIKVSFFFENHKKS